MIPRPGTPVRQAAPPATDAHIRAAAPVTTERSPEGGERAVVFASPRVFGLILLAGLVQVAAVGLAALLLPMLGPATLSFGLGLVVYTAAALVAGGIASLAWIRFREFGQAHELFQASAFLVLAASELSAIVLMIANAGQGGVPRTAGVVPGYALSGHIDRTAAALLFVAAGFVGQAATAKAPRRPHLWLFGPLVLLLGLSWLLLGPGQGSALVAELEARALPGLDLSMAVLFLSAAYLFSRAYVRLDEAPIAYLVLGLVVAAIAHLYPAIAPGAMTPLLRSEDLFRVLFYVILLVGVAVGMRGDLRILRRANEALIQLRAVELRSAALAERSRLARDIHDGLVQDLWVARLKAAHLVDLSGLPEEASRIAGQLDTSLDAALAEARQALESLVPESGEGRSLSSAIGRLLEDLPDRYEVDVRADVDPELPALPARVEKEVLRIIREAVVNAGKHADATIVRITASITHGSLVVLVEDNGRGFDAGRTPSGYGLRSMQERAALIDAELRIDTRPMDGTRVRIAVPLAHVAEPGEATAGAPDG